MPLGAVEERLGPWTSTSTPRPSEAPQAAGVGSTSAARRRARRGAVAETSDRAGDRRARHARVDVGSCAGAGAGRPASSSAAPGRAWKTTESTRLTRRRCTRTQRAGGRGRHAACRRCGSARGPGGRPSAVGEAAAPPVARASRGGSPAWPRTRQDASPAPPCAACPSRPAGLPAVDARLPGRALLSFRSSRRPTGLADGLARLALPGGNAWIRPEPRFPRSVLPRIGLGWRYERRGSICTADRRAAPRARYHAPPPRDPAWRLHAHEDLRRHPHRPRAQLAARRRRGPDPRPARHPDRRRAARQAQARPTRRTSTPATSSWSSTRRRSPSPATSAPRRCTTATRATRAA